jgi:hypothetical protein
VQECAKVMGCARCMHKEIIIWKPLQSSSLQISIEEMLCGVTSFSVSSQCCQTHSLQAAGLNIALLVPDCSRRHFVFSLRNVSKIKSKAKKRKVRPRTGHERPQGVIEV